MDSAKLTGIFRRKESPSSNRGSKSPVVDHVAASTNAPSTLILQEKLSALELSLQSEMKRKDETIADLEKQIDELKSEHAQNLDKQILLQKQQIEELQSNLRDMESASKDKAQHEDISIQDERTTQNDTPSENVNAKNKASLGDTESPLVAAAVDAKEATTSQYDCAPSSSAGTSSDTTPEDPVSCESIVDDGDNSGYENDGGYVEVCFLIFSSTYMLLTSLILFKIKI